MILSVPVPPLTLSKAVKVSVAKKVNVSAPVPPKILKLPAALAEIFKELDNESPAATDP